MFKSTKWGLGAALLAATLTACTDATDATDAPAAQQSPAVAVATPVAAASNANIADAVSGIYKEDNNHAYLMFSYDHNGYSRPLIRLEDFDVTLDLNTSNPEASTIEVDINMAGISTGVAVFNEHILADRWLDGAKFPTARFVSTKLTQLTPSTGVMSGDVTIKGITKPIDLNVTFKKAGEHRRSGAPMIGLSATGTLIRSEFGVGGGAPAISDEVLIQIEMEMFLQQE